MNVLVVDTDRRDRENAIRILESLGHDPEPVLSGADTLRRLREDSFELVLSEVQLGSENGLSLLEGIQRQFPRTLVALATAQAPVETAVRAMRQGALDFLEKPLTTEKLRALVLRAEKLRHLQTEIETLEDQLSVQSGPPMRFDSSDAMVKQALELIFRAAATPASILILGESGTGKSQIARAIHERSHLKNRPFVTVPCPSLSKELLESELFGHVKGSFTGAIRDKWGKVHAAHGGTLFLDEIGELPLEIQPKLLRLLQEREYERLGDTVTHRAEVRVIAATNKNLKQHVQDGNFREDLYYRLNVIAVEMPPLRRRPSDLMQFSVDYLHYFAEQSRRKVKGFTPEALSFMSSYRWPGNLRELRNAVERAVILCKGEVIERTDLPEPRPSAKIVESDEADFIVPGGNVTIDQLELEHIRKVLARSSSLQDAARILGIDQATLYRKRRRMGLE